MLVGFRELVRKEIPNIYRVLPYFANKACFHTLTATQKIVF